MLFDAFDTNAQGAITLDNMTFLESWEIDDGEKVVLPKKIKKKPKIIAHVAPTLALYRSQYEKEVAEKLTEQMANSNRLSRKSAYFGFSKELEDVRRQEEIKAYRKTRESQLHLQRMNESKPLEDNDFGLKPIMIDFGIADPEPPPEFVTSVATWTHGATMREGACLPLGYSAPVQMPEGLFDEFFSTGQSTKPGAVVDLPKIQTDIGETDEAVTVADLPDLSEMLQRRETRRSMKMYADDSTGRLGRNTVTSTAPPAIPGPALAKSQTEPTALNITSTSLPA